MPYQTALISTIVVAFVLAFCAGFVARKMKISPLVGYLMAGIAIGPFTPGFVADLDLAAQLAELGVILLMFGVGLHISFADLLAVRAIAFFGACAQMVVTVAASAGFFLLLGWSLESGLLLGLALSVASTVVLLRLLEERGELDTIGGRIAVAWLIVQDIAMVLVLVLLPVFAEIADAAPGTDVSSDAGAELALTILLTLAKLAAFIALMLVVGRRAAPWLLRHVARTGSRELFTLAVLASALGIAYGSAELFGASFALGAFFAGVVLSESDFSHQAAANSLPFRDAFAVLFFVSVGMLFDPTVLVERPLVILAVLAIIILVKSVPAMVLLIAFRYPAGAALTVTTGLAQIGEFSFILVGMGVALGMIPPEGRDLVLAGALLSITINPALLALKAPAARWMHSHPRLIAAFKRSGDHLTELAPTHGDSRHEGHIILVGYGRVGNAVGDILAEHGLPFVVVELNRRVVETIRGRGIQAIYGDAGAPGVLTAALVEHARLLIVASPDALHTREIFRSARAANPLIEGIARSHSDRERAVLEEAGVNRAIVGERELAAGIARYALQRLEIAPHEPRAED
ncbi:MAG: cation:proton antiporter [Proteobacteria bacterium]|nr:cation:proton antiporter [Pseudomonadota bacterium]